MSNFIEVDETNFEGTVIQAKQPVILEFGAEWCVPCKRLEPILAQIGTEWKGKATFCKASVDSCPQLVQRYQVMSVPTTILFFNGEACQQLTGLQTRERLIEKFSPYLKG